MRLNICSCVLAMLAGCGLARAQEQPAPAPPSPPDQREAGPGGRDYVYDGVITTRYGEGADGYWLFEPAGADKQRPLPVVGLMHGLNATHYGGSWLWIRHLVRKGNVVVYPQYQQGFVLDPTTFTDKSAVAIADALKRLDGGRHVKADGKRFALAGHSLGGTIAANLAARHEHYMLPRARAVMPVLPGDVRTDKGLGAFFPSLIEDHASVPRGTLLLVVAAEDDNIVGQGVARRIYHGAEQVPTEDKDFVLLHADGHGRPALVADHFVNASYVARDGRVVADAFDYALWRWLDALMDAAFDEGRHREIALGGTHEQRDLGKWSDGTPVRKPTVTDEP